MCSGVRFDGQPPSSHGTGFGRDHLEHGNANCVLWSAGDNHSDAVRPQADAANEGALARDRLPFSIIVISSSDRRTRADRLMFAHTLIAAAQQNAGDMSRLPD